MVKHAFFFHLFYKAGVAALILCTAFSCASQQLTEPRNETPPRPEVQQQEESHADQKGIHVLFLGDDGHHQPGERIRHLVPYMAERGIYLHYTDRQEDLTRENLKKFDVFMQYGNRTGLSREQEHALLGYVREGGGFVALHSASASFNDSDAFVNLVGGAFKAHGSGTFGVTRLEPDHPVLQGVPDFESWDETYVHMKHNPDKTVLSVRIEDGHEEPWTWIRNHGEGRVFYSAWGHDERTWAKDGFKKLVENGIRWSAGDRASESEFALPVFTYGEGELPYYPEGEPWGTVGDPITEIQNPLTPEESLAHIVVEPALDVELFASEDQVINPIDMTWDERGRLWVTETVDYPNSFAPDREGNDRIKILEDTDNDGKADKVTVFADGLNIPTSLVLANGGVIVAQAPDFIFLKDTDGDDVADQRDVLFTGWGTFDTHAGPNNLHYGFDNQIWGAVGYSAFEGTVGGREHQFSSGFYRFQPDGSRLEYISSTTNNTWGLGFNEEGMVFGSTANRDVPVHSVIPNRFYHSIRGIERIPRLPMIANSNRIFPLREMVRQVDQHGRYTAGSGFHVYTARDFPPEYWNRRAFISEPTGHLMGEFILEPNGSTYTAYNKQNMMASLDEWFSPVQAKVGPDGALWVLDWYNLVIQHNPTPEGYEVGEGNAYVNELRDQDHARIYRIVNRNAGHTGTLNLEDASPDELVATLTNENLFWRLTAQRLLVERGEQDVLPQLYRLVENQKTDLLGLNAGALHALWTIHGLGALDGSNREAFEIAAAALHHPSSAVRRTALMVLPRNEESLNRILAADFVPNPDVPGEMDYVLPTSTMSASDPHVRVAALLALAEMPASERSGIAAAEIVVMEENVNDRWMRDAATAAGAANEDSFLGHVLKKQLPEYADSTYKANVQTAVERVARHYAMGDQPGSIVGDFLVTLEGADPVIGAAFLAGLADGWPEEQAPAMADRMRNDLNRLRSVLPEEFHENLDLLEEKWELPQLFGSP